MLIEVIHTPPGDSPEWIRKAWVGMQLPCVHDGPVSMPTVNASAGPRTFLQQILHLMMGRTTQQLGYVVNAKDAVGLLSLYNEEAARWWITSAPHALKPEQMIMFAKQCCREITPDELA